MNCNNNEITTNEKLINKLRFMGLKSMFSDLNKINYAVIKGESTSLYAYGQTNKRYYNDIDILINKKDMFQIEYILNKNGLKKTETDRQKELFFNLFSHQSIPYQMFYHGINIIIDFNYDIFWGEQRNQNSKSYINDFLEDTVKVNIYGVDVNILEIKKAFIQLCLHCYKDLNSLYLLYSRKRINKNNLYEIYYILKRHTIELSEKIITQLAYKYKVSPYLYVVFCYIYELTHDQIIQSYMDILKDEEGQKLLNTYGLSEYKEWKIDIEERLTCEDLYSVIFSDLSDKDLTSIKNNIQAFGVDFDG